MGNEGILSWLQDNAILQSAWPQLRRRFGRRRGINETEPLADRCGDGGKIIFVFKEMCLNLEAFVVSPFQLVDERTEGGHHGVLWGHTLLQQAYGEKHSCGQSLSQRRERFLV